MAQAQGDEMTSTSNSHSLKEILKERIVRDVIGDAQSKMDKRKTYSLIVADDHTIKIISKVLKMHELNDLNIGVVLNVAYDRERVKVSPIYFLSPNQKSIQNMCDDYKDPKNPRYGAPVHAYFCSSLPDSLIQLVTSSSIRKYLATFKEIPCDLLILEKRVFSFNRDNAFSQLYINKKNRSDELINTSKQLISLFLSLNEEPYIRYSKDSISAGQLASSFHKNINDLKKNKKFKGFNSTDKQQPTLIIMDRSDDPITPLLHELTFQAMVVDLFSDRINDGKIKMKNDGGGDEKKNDNDNTNPKQEIDKNSRAMPDESDEIWVQYRHTHIADVSSKLQKQFDDWKKTNAVVRMKSQQSSGNMDSKTLMAAAQSMPQYKTLIKKYTTNINLAVEIGSYLREYNLLKLIELEQDIITGIDEDGKKCDRTRIQREISNLLIDANKPQELKLRMFMMYVISQGGMKPNQRRQLMDQSGFDSNCENIIFNLGSLGVLLQSDKPIEGHKNKNYWKSVQKNAKPQSSNNNNNNNIVRFDTRFTSYLEWVLESHRKDSLSNNDFEWIEQPKKAVKKQRIATSYRRHTKQQLQKNTNNQGRIIVYVLGGVSYSEMRACYQFSEKHNIDVFIGSTSILSPKKYLELLSEQLEQNETL